MRFDFLSPGSDRNDDHDLARAWSGMDRIARLPSDQRGFALFETRGDYRPLGLSPEDVDGIDASHPAFPQAVAQRDVEPVVSHPIPNPRPLATPPPKNAPLQPMEPPASWNWEPEPAENLTDRQARYEAGRRKAIEQLGKIATTDLAYSDAQATKAYLESGVLTPSFYRAKNASPWAQGAGYDGNRAIFDIDGMIKVARDYNPQLADDPDYLDAYLASAIAHEANHAREFAQGVAPFRGRTPQQKRDMELNSYQLQQSLLRTTGYNTKDINPVGVDDPVKLRDLLYDREAYANGHGR